MKLGNEEHGIGRPWVVRAVDRYQLFFSRRSLAHGGEYRLGYAESNDGISWRRMDEDLNLDVSDSGWDSKAIMYAVVTRINEQTWCFYNGNDFGREGFGTLLWMNHDHLRTL